MYRSSPKASANLPSSPGMRRSRKKDGGSSGSDYRMDTFTFVIIIVASILVTITLSATYFFISSILGTFSIIIGPLVGAFVGVIFGFWINRRHDKELEEKRRSFFKNLIMHETEESIKILESIEPDLYEKVKLIPEDAWNSLVNSGDIALLEETKAMDLSDAYFRIKRYNQEAEKIKLRAATPP
jgi:hypothetical protein